MDTRNPDSPEGPGPRRRSLRAELLYALTFLTSAALLITLWVVAALGFAHGVAEVFWPLLLLVGFSALIFALLGSYLIDRLVLRPLRQVSEVATAIAGGEYARRIPPGETREMSALAYAFNDLTDQLLHNQERLAENVQSLHDTNEKLMRTQRELVQAEKLASIGRLAAGVAHEVGNPLGAVLGYAAVLRRRGADSELIDGVEREARRIDRIVRGLLEYARPASGPKERIDLNASITRVLALLREQGRLEEVEVQLRLEEPLPPVLAGAHKIDQTFVNLLLNAEVAMDGRGRITITTSREVYYPSSTVRARRADDPPGVDYSHLRRRRAGARDQGERLVAGDEVVRVVVEDTGPGVPEENMETIFDPFFTTKAPGEGTGLGLAIVASTVAEMGGRVDVSSAEGGGAAFALAFPAADLSTGERE